MNQYFFDNNGNELYFRISNSDGKIWVIPDSNSRLALQLYQPSSRKGKMLKKYYPAIRHISFVRNLLGISEHKYSVETSFSNLLCRLFKVTDIQISVFCGTPSVHQKVSIQISNEAKILGYCKLSEKEEVKKLFNTEEILLKELADKGIADTPRCLFNGEWQNGIKLFVQTTSKTKHSKVPHKFSNIQRDFLNQLFEKTKTRIAFERSDFYRSLQLIKQNLHYLAGFEAKLIPEAIETVEHHYRGKLVDFSVCHSDFTPWNMFVEKGNLFVFDWEYAARTCPPFLDAFHFLTQSYIFEKQKNASEIFKAYKSDKFQLLSFTENPDMLYMSYLLYIISFYTNRQKGLFDSVTSNNIKVWLKLVSYLQKEQL